MLPMKSIILFIPYFGKLPSYFPLFLESCRYNNTIDFLLFTDDETQYDYPPNVSVKYMPFSSFADRIQQMYSFHISLAYPYKLCDYKPAYGEICAKEFAGYDFWGYCDIDLVFGNLRKVLTTELLSQYDKIGVMGHLSLYRNTPVINSVYRLLVDEAYPYKAIYTDDTMYAFDEWGFLGRATKTANEIFEKYDFSICYLHEFADLAPFTDKFYECQFSQTERQYTCKRMGFYRFDKGTLSGYSPKGLKQGEYLYVHFLKRPMRTCVPHNAKQYDIVPNAFVRCKGLHRLYLWWVGTVDVSKRKRQYLTLKGKLCKLAKKVGIRK